MIWLLSIPIIFCLTFTELIHSDWDDWDFNTSKRGFLRWCGLILVGCFLSSLISLVPIGVSSFIGSLPKIHGVKDVEYPLIALREKDGIKGQFYFLGAGVVSDRQYYFWYRRDPQGQISGGKTLRDPGVRIYEYDGTPKMVTFKTEYVSKWITKYIWIIGIDMRSNTNWYPDFYIPKNSIQEGFVL